MIDWLLTDLKGRFFDALSAVSGYVYLAEWYVALAALLAAFIAVSVFIPFKWPRAALGFLWLLAASFVAGLTVMFRHNRDENKALRDQVAKLRQHQRQQDQGWWR